MAERTASRTLVKSAPELWAECSDAASLARHLGAFGEIRITRLEPETAVAWEGDAARGTVVLEPSGWGTKVVLTATPETPVAVQADAPPPSRDEARPSPEPEARGQTWLARLIPWWPRRAEPSPEPPAQPDVPAPVQPAEEAGERTERVLTEALDSLGRAHHRPYSRA
jgi:hypothetical protein